MASLNDLADRARESLIAVGASTDAVGNRWCIASDLAFRLGCTLEQADQRLEDLAVSDLVELVPASEVASTVTRFWRLTDDGRQALAENARRQGHRPAGEGDGDVAA